MESYLYYYLPILVAAILFAGLAAWLTKVCFKRIITWAKQPAPRPCEKNALIQYVCKLTATVAHLILFGMALVFTGLTAFMLIVHVILASELACEFVNTLEPLSNKQTNLDAANLIESYAGVLVGLAAVVSLWLQVQDIRQAQKAFTLSARISMLLQELDTSRRAIDTILPMQLAHGVRSSATNYWKLLAEYKRSCLLAGNMPDRDFQKTVTSEIEKLAAVESRLENLQTELEKLEQRTGGNPDKTKGA